MCKYVSRCYCSLVDPHINNSFSTDPTTARHLCSAIAEGYLGYALANRPLPDWAGAIRAYDRADVSWEKAAKSTTQFTTGGAIPATTPDLLFPTFCITAAGRAKIRVAQNFAGVANLAFLQACSACGGPATFAMMDVRHAYEEHGWPIPCGPCHRNPMQCGVWKRVEDWSHGIGLIIM